MVLTFLQSVCKYVYNIKEFTASEHWHLDKYYCVEIRLIHLSKVACLRAFVNSACSDQTLANCAQAVDLTLRNFDFNFFRVHLIISSCTLYEKHIDQRCTV